MAQMKFPKKSCFRPNEQFCLKFDPKQSQPISQDPKTFFKRCSMLMLNKQMQIAEVKFTRKIIFGGLNGQFWPNCGLKLQKLYFRICHKDSVKPCSMKAYGKQIKFTLVKFPPIIFLGVRAFWLFWKHCIPCSFFMKQRTLKYMKILFISSEKFFQFSIYIFPSFPLFPSVTHCQGR